MNVINYLGVGTAHLDRKDICQDYADYRTYDNGDFILAISDGCSGCSLPRQAAEQNVNAVIDYYDRLTELAVYEDENLMLWYKLELLNHIKRFLADEARNHGLKSLDELSATLLFAVKRGDRLLIGHIGDGCIFAFKKESAEPFASSMPDNGASSSETFFTNAANATDHFFLRLYNASGLRNVVMFSDGPQKMYLADTVEETAKNVFITVNEVREGRIKDCAGLSRHLNNNVYGYPFLLNDDWSVLLYDSEGEQCSDKITKPEKMYYQYLLKHLYEVPGSFNYTLSRIRTYEEMYDDIPPHIYEPKTEEQKTEEREEEEPQTEATEKPYEDTRKENEAKPEQPEIPTAQEDNKNSAAVPEALLSRLNAFEASASPSGENTEENKKPQEDYVSVLADGINSVPQSAGEKHIHKPHNDYLDIFEDKAPAPAETDLNETAALPRDSAFVNEKTDTHTFVNSSSENNVSAEELNILSEAFIQTEAADTAVPAASAAPPDITKKKSDTVPEGSVNNENSTKEAKQDIYGILTDVRTADDDDGFEEL